MKPASRVLNSSVVFLSIVMAGILGEGSVVYATEPARGSGPAATRPEAQPTGVEQDLIKLEKQWWEACKTRDKAALERILADEYLGIDNDAVEPQNKREWIEQRVNGESRVASYSLEHFEVRVVGDTAVVAVRYSLEMNNKGVEHTEHSVDMDTFVRRGGRWQALGTAEESLPVAK